MNYELIPGCVSAHLRHKAAVLKQLELEDQLLSEALIEKVPSLLRPLFDADRYIFDALLEAGLCERRYKEPKTTAVQIYPSVSVLRSRLRALRNAWSGLIKISIRRDSDTGIRVRFTVINPPDS